MLFKNKESKLYIPEYEGEIDFNWSENPLYYRIPRLFGHRGHREKGSRADFMIMMGGTLYGLRATWDHWTELVHSGSFTIGEWHSTRNEKLPQSSWRNNGRDCTAMWQMHHNATDGRQYCAMLHISLCKSSYSDHWLLVPLFLCW